MYMCIWLLGIFINISCAPFNVCASSLDTIFIGAVLNVKVIWLNLDMFIFDPFVRALCGQLF